MKIKQPKKTGIFSRLKETKVIYQNATCGPWLDSRSKNIAIDGIWGTSGEISILMLIFLHVNGRVVMQGMS